MAPGSWPGSPRLLALPRPQHPQQLPFSISGTWGSSLAPPGSGLGWTWVAGTWESHSPGSSRRKGAQALAMGARAPDSPHTGSQGPSQPGSTWAWQSVVPVSVCDHRAGRYLGAFSEGSPGPSSARPLQSLLCSRIQERPLVAGKALGRFSFPFTELHFLNFCVPP